MSDADDGYRVATQADLDAWQQQQAPAQDRSSPMDSAVADLNVQASQQAAAGVPEDQIDSQLMQKAQGAQDKQYGKKSTKIAKDDGYRVATVQDIWDWQDRQAQGRANPNAVSDIDAERLGYTPTQNFGGDVYNSPNAALRTPDTFQAPPESASDYIKALGTTTRASLGEAMSGKVQEYGEAAKSYLGNVMEPFKELTGIQESPVEDVAKGAADVGAKQFSKYAKEEEKARGNLIQNPEGVGQNLAYIAQETAINAPPLGAAMAMGPAGGGALFDVLTSGKKYGQARAEGESPAVAAQAAEQEGAITGITQDLTLGRALNPATMTALHRIGSATGTNIAGSVLSEAANIDTEIHTEGKQLTRAEIQDRLAKAAESATVVGAGLGAAGAVMHPTHPAELAAGRTNAAVDQLIANNPAQAGEAPPSAMQPAETQPPPTEETPADQTIHASDTVAGNTVQEPEKAPAFTPDERHKEKVETLLSNTAGLTDAQKDTIRQNFPDLKKHALTGYDQPDEIPDTITAAQKSGNPSSYLGVDIKGLHPLNDAMGSRAAADVHVKAMLDMVHDEAQKTGAQVAPFQDGAGDEFGYVLNGADATTTHQAALAAQAKVDDYVKANGLDALHNNRTNQTQSTGIHFAAQDIRPNDTPQLVLQRTDAAITKRKNGAPYESPKPIAETGPGELPTAGLDGSVEPPGGEVSGGKRPAGDTPQTTSLDDINYVIFSDKDVKVLNKYRQGDAAEGVTEPEARAALTKEFGNTAVRKMEAAGLRFTSKSELPRLSPELTQTQREGVKALTTKAGQPHIIHDQAPASEIPGLAVHEIWHANADRILPSSKQAELAGAVERVARTSPKVAEEIARIPATTSKHQLTSEKIAYALQSVHTPGIATKALDAIKIGLNRLGVPKNWLDANEALLRRIGSENLKHFTESGPRTYQTVSTERQSAPAIKPRYRVPVEDVPVSRTGAPERTAETPTVEGKPVGVKNAAKAEERSLRGLEPEVSALRPSDKAVWDQAAKQRAEDPTAGYRLSDELAHKPRQTSDAETALLIQHGAELNNRYDDVLNKIADAQKSGDKNAEINANLTRQSIETQLATHDKASKESGTEWSAAGRMRQKLAERDFSMARQIMRFKAIEGGELSNPMRQRVEGSVRRIADLEKNLQAARNENERLKQSPVQRRAPVQKKTLDDDFAQLAKRAAELRKPVQAEAAYARVEDPELATVIRKMARNRSDAGETDANKILDAIHQAIGGSVPKQDISDTITSNAPYRKGTKSELQQRYTDMKRALSDPGVKKDAARQKQLLNKLADIKSSIQRKDFDPPQKKPSPEKSEAVKKLEVDVAREKKRLNALADQRARLTDTPVGKTTRLLQDYRIFDILASVAVFKKLIAAAVTRNATQIGEEALGAAAARLPGLSKYAQWSPRYHGRDFWRGEIEAAKGLGGAVVRGIEDAWHGQNKWDALYGDKHLSGEYTDFAGQLGSALQSPGIVNKVTESVHATAGLPGRSHAVIKEFVSEPEMNRAMFKIATYERTRLTANGHTPEQIEEYMGRDSTRAMIESRAYEYALESKFQGKNMFTDSINGLLTRWEKDGTLGKLAAFGVKTEWPIRGIPMNIAKELLTSYPFGAIKAALKMKGFEKLSDGDKEKAADYIMKNIRKQGMGIVLLATGMALRNQLGGVPGAEKKKQNGIKPGEAEIADTNFSTQLMHGPGPELLEMGASLMRVYEADYGKSDNAFLSAMTALAQVYPTLALQSIPYTDQVRRQIDAAGWAQKDGRSGMSAVIGDLVRSGVVPQAVQTYAREHDPYTGWRKPKNIGQDIELGIPGHGIPGIIPGREDVPAH